MWVLLGLAGACLVGMIVAVAYDATHYGAADSAPFGAFVLIRAIEFGFPALLLVGAALIVRSRPGLFR